MKLRKLIVTLAVFVFAMAEVNAQTTENPGEYSNNIKSDQENCETYDGPTFRHKERRLEKPLQIQFVQMMASSRPHGAAPGAGLHLGYQLSDLMYVGLTSTAFFDGRNILDDAHSYQYDDDEYYDRKTFGQEGAEKTESSLDPRHLFELRLTPWDFGLYFSLGALYQGEQTSTTTFKKESREVGYNTYTTALEATVVYKEWYSAATGIGFNYIFANGLTLGTSMNIGLGAQTPDVTVSADSAVSEADLNYWKKQIKSNEKQAPFMITGSIGYAF